MARLFVTSRDIDFINDISRELHKDVIGQVIYYYRVRDDLTETHDVYEEAIMKVFDPPVEIEMRVDWEPKETETNQYGSEKMNKIIAYLHQRDLLDRGIQVREGDYFSYGDTFYEIVEAIVNRQVFGQIEHTLGYKIVGHQARIGKIDFRPLGPTSEGYTDSDAVQETFVQQRGLPSNRLGVTGDQRDLQKRGTLDAPISGPREVSPAGSDIPDDSSFYEE